MLVLEPYIPLAWWLSLAVAAAAAVAIYAWTGRRRLARRRFSVVVALMIVALALPLGLLLNPTWVDRLPPPEGKPRLTILLDRSASMKTADAEQGQTRFAAAAKLASSVSTELAKNFDVTIATFAENSTPSSADKLAAVTPDGAASDIAAALDDAIADRPQGQAILLLSDGANNGDNASRRLAAAAEKAHAMSVPVFTRTFGGPGNVADVEVSVDAPQELAFVSQQVPITVRLKQRGAKAVETKVALDVDGKGADQRVVRLVPNGETSTTYQVVQQKPGLYRYQFRADAAPGEATPLNNQATLLLRVIDEPVRVLLLEGKPYWDTKFLVRTLAADPSVELVSMVRLAEGRVLERTITRTLAGAEHAAADKPAPRLTDTTKPDAGKSDTTKVNPDKKAAGQGGASPSGVTDHWRIQTNAHDVLSDPKTLNRFQVVVLGRDADVFLTNDAVTQLKKWLLDHDGSLVCFRGPPASQISRRLGELMPVRWTTAREQRFRVLLTDRGRQLQWLPHGDDADAASLASLPSLVSIDTIEQTKPLTEVLAQGVESVSDSAARPVIAYQPYGNGRVVVIEGAGMWRWAFLPPEFSSQQQVYGTLWRSLMRWLVSQVSLLPSQRLALRTDKVSYNTGEPVGLTLLAHEDQLSGSALEVELSGKSLDKPRRYKAAPAAQALGQFQVPLGPLPEGEYRAQVVGHTKGDSSAAALFDVRGNLVERLEVASRGDLMKTLAERTGGSTDVDTPQAVAQRLEEHIAATRPERSIRLMAWDRWWVLAGVLGLWGTAWGLRRMSGLI